MAELTLQITKGDLYAMTEFARRHLEGDGMERDEMKAVEVLEDCAHSEIPDAMLMLAKCCALGRGIARDTRRARKLISDAAKRGNEEAGLLMKLFNELRQQHRVDLWSLYHTRSQENVACFHFVLLPIEGIKGEYTIERVALLLAVSSWESVELNRKSQEQHSVSMLSNSLFDNVLKRKRDWKRRCDSCG